MRTVLIQEVKIRNYRSFRNLTISFPNSLGLRMLAGENGKGKSSFWDAIEWCLHASSIQGSKISDTLTWEEETASVTLKLLVNGQQNTIHRYGPPVKVELNGELVEQPKIDELIGLSRLRFLHSVIFGQDQKLFPDLPVPERGALLDDVLGLGVWQKATEAAGAKYSDFEKQLLEKRSDLTYINGRLASLQMNATVEKEIANWEQDKENQLYDIRNSILAYETEQNVIIENLEKQKEEWKTKILEQIEAKALEIENLEAELAPIKFKDENVLTTPFAVQIGLLEKQLQDENKEREDQLVIIHQCNSDYQNCLKAEGFWANDKCPVCNQQITKEKKNHELQCSAKIKQELEVKINEASEWKKRAEASILATDKELRDYRETTIRENEKNKAIKKEVLRIEAQIAILEHEAKRLITQFDSNDNPYEKQIVQLKQRENPYEKQERDLLVKVNPFVEKLDNLKKDRKQLERELVAQELSYKSMEAQMTAAEYWKHGFKRIRLYFVQQVLSALQIEIQSAISSLGLNGWSVELSTETLTKSETVKLGIQLTIKSHEIEANWNVFSGGEKQRLRLGIALGLASLIQRASGVVWHLEVLDEQSKSLDAQGIEDLLETLRNRTDTLKKQIWISDHTNLQFAGFDSVWTVTKDKDGSHIEVGI